MRSPVAIACGYFAGLSFGAWVSQLPSPAILSLACFGVASAVTLGLARSPSPVLLWLAPKLLVALSVAAGLYAAPPRASEPLPPPGMAQLTADVEEVRYGRSGEARARIRVLSGQRVSDGAALPEGTHLNSVPHPLPEGARVSLLGAVRPALPFRNPSPHPPLIAAHPTRGVLRLAGPGSSATLSQPWASGVLDTVRCHVRARLSASLAADVEPVARAILLGDPDALDPGAEDAVRGAGLSHVFAVSGMHVSLLAGLAMWLATRLLLRVPRVGTRYDPRRIAAGLGVPLALAIAPLTGGAPSGWRASITTAIAWTVVACGRRPDPAAVAAAACLVFGVATPYDALRPAFLLSIAATAALIGQPAALEPGLMANLRTLGLLTARTTLATAPLVWWSFGSLPLVGLLANLLLVPLGSALLLLAAGHALLACAVPALAPLSAYPLGVAARAFLRGADACNDLDPHFTLPVLSLGQGLALAGGVCVVLFAHSVRPRVYGVVVALLACGACEWQLRREEKPVGRLRATFLDVGQGDSALLDLPNGQAMLIDAGGNPQGGADPGARVIVPLLAARRRAQIETAVLTHPHPDHYGGLHAVLASVPVRELWDSGQAASEHALSETSRQAHALLQSAAARGTRLLTPEQLCGPPRDIGGARVRVLSPCPGFDPGHDPNDNSLVLHVSYAGRSLLFAGDVEAHAEQRLVQDPAALQADVLKVPHHGSRTSSSESFLRAVRPSVAIVSAGAANSFGHPHPEVMARLRQLVPKVVDLGERGGTIVDIDGEGAMSVTSVEPACGS